MKIQDLKQLNKDRMAKATASVQKQENFIKLADSISKSLSNIDPKQFKAVSESLSALSRELKGLPGILDKINKSDNDAMITCLKDIQTSINSKDYTPKIDVKSPSMPSIDISPITRAIESLKEKEVSVDLENYRGVIIDDESDSMQYIGFLSPSGEWYIICNEISEKKMLYAFGRSDFGKAWDSHMSLGYKMLDVAVAEVYSEVSA